MRHDPLEDAAYTGNGHTVSAYLRHKSGIANAQVYWTTDTAAGFVNNLPMNATGGNNWSADIPRPTTRKHHLLLHPCGSEQR